MKITLIRHTSVNVEPGICYGFTDVPLNDTFEAEATVTHANLGEKLFDKVFVSPLSRCVRLADYCGFEDATRDDRLKEMNFGEWEMKRFDEIVDPRLEEWYVDYLNYQTPGGESFRMQLERVSTFLNELKRETYEHVAIFAHGGVLLCAQVYAGVITKEEAFSALTPYGGIVRITI